MVVQVSRHLLRMGICMDNLVGVGIFCRQDRILQGWRQSEELIFWIRNSQHCYFFPRFALRPPSPWLSTSASPDAIASMPGMFGDSIGVGCVEGA